MKIIITEHQLKTVLAEQNRIVGFAKDLYNKFFGDEEKKPEQKSLTPKIIPFTKENFAKYIKEIGIVHPDIVIAQAMIESGHFTSNLFKSNNNIFGMKFPRQRKTTAAGEKNGSFYNVERQDGELMCNGEQVYSYQDNNILLVLNP